MLELGQARHFAAITIIEDACFSPDSFMEVISGDVILSGTRISAKFSDFGYL